MNGRQRRKLFAGAGMITMLVGALLALAPAGAGADDLPVVSKVTVCHRTNAPTNPYRIVEVAVDGSDGSLGNGNNDHTSHLGDPFDFSDPDQYQPPFNGDDWGDIIPPYRWGPGENQVYPGYNWTEGVSLAVQCTGQTDEPPVYSIAVDKVNNADGQGGFGDSEEAPQAEAAVPFQLTITNDGDAAVTIDSVLDTWPGQAEPLDVLSLDSLSCETGGGAAEVVLDGLSLAPAASVVCTFTLSGYAPPAGGSRVNTLSVDTEEGANDDDTSTVTTPQSAAYSIAVVKTNDANGDQAFGDPEQAPAAGADVPFRLVMSNTGTGDLTVTSLQDAWGAQTLDLLSDAAGMTCTVPDGDDEGGAPDSIDIEADGIPAGTVVTCNFTVAGYAPAAGGNLTNTVTLDTEETADVQDTSTVTTPGGGGCVGDCGFTPPPCVDDLSTAVNECNPQPPVVITDVCPQTPGRQTLIESCVEVLPEEVTPPTPTPPAPPAPPAPTPPAEPQPAVQGDVVTRTLPRTGTESQDLAAFGAGLLLLGAGLVLTSRLRFRSVD